MKIEHQFKTKAHDLIALFDKTNKMSTFQFFGTFLSGNFS